MPKITIPTTQKSETYFLTFTVIDWTPIFNKVRFCNVIIDSFKFFQSKESLILYGYVIMPDHLHLIATSNDMIHFVQGFKSYTTHKLLGLIQNEYIYSHIFFNNNAARIWCSTNMPKIIETDYYFQQKLEYIHNNPVKKGYVHSPEEWKYSSARNYFLDDDSIISIQTDRE